MDVRGRRRPVWAVAVLALVTLAACGGDDSGDERSARSTSTSTASPRSIEVGDGGVTTGDDNAGPTSSPSTSSGPGAPGTTPTSGPEPTTTTTTTTTPDDVTHGGPASASRLSASAACEGTPPRAVVRLRWQPSGAGVQRVDVSVLDNDFEPGTFDSSETLTVDSASLQWNRSKGEATHHWRVLTKVKGGWVSSDTATFEGPGCVGSDPQQP